MTKFLELFICPVQDKIVRGTDIIYSPDAENPEKLTGRCSLCGATVEKPVSQLLSDIKSRYPTKNAEDPRPTHIKPKARSSVAERKTEQIEPDEKVYRLVFPPKSRESEEIDRKIEEKENRYEKYLDDLAENDPDAFREKNVDFYYIAALIGEQELVEFDALMRKRHELMAIPTLVEVKER
jgi:hypothetical protein